MKFHHIGVSVPDIDSVIPNMLGDFVAITGKVYDGGQNAVLQMFNDNGCHVELIEKGDGQWDMYHRCYEVDSLIDGIESAKKRGYMQITEAKEAPLFDGRRVVFLMGKDKDIIELLERKDNDAIVINWSEEHEI